MELHMGLTKKTTILLQPELHTRLRELARRRGTSIGELIRDACVRQYGLGATDDRLAAVRELAELSLPVGTPEEMKRESVQDPEELLP